MHCDMYQFSYFWVDRIWLISRFLLVGHFGRHLTTLAMISNFLVLNDWKGWCDYVPVGHCIRCFSIILCSFLWIFLALFSSLVIILTGWLGTLLYCWQLYLNIGILMTSQNWPKKYSLTFLIWSYICSLFITF